MTNHCSICAWLTLHFLRGVACQLRERQPFVHHCLVCSCRIVQVILYYCASVSVVEGSEWERMTLLNTLACSLQNDTTTWSPDTTEWSW